ncbi:Pumilio y domain member 6, partial [Elasticomyces elasticus]
MSQTKREAPSSDASAQKRQKTFHKPDSNGAKAGYNKYSRTNQKNGAKENKHEVFHADTSREAHVEQKRVKQERLNAKPNSDLILRSKKLWEKLRLKCHVQKDERAKLVAELFEIITGRVKDFVFKHDSVRVIQCALKYATVPQRQQIAEELRGSYRELAESKYAKFLIAKMIVQDPKVRDLVVPEFYGHVKRLIRHPEAGWIMDDIYRQMATKEQKARLLREWYGAEFVVFDKQDEKKEITADLKTIIEEAPGKKGHIMTHLKEMTNQLVQKKTHAFTMLHDALLQYFLNTALGSAEYTEFLDTLRDDEEGDLTRNLAFTKSGSHIVSLAIAYGSSKDRRNILKHLKTHVKALAADPSGHLVLLTAYECVDDTVMTAKALFGELTSKDLSAEERDQELLAQASNINARMPLLFLMAKAGESPKWLCDTVENEILAEVRMIRKETSKKDPETRRVELNKAISQPMLDHVASQALALLATSFGCQFIGEVLLGAIGEKDAAVTAVAEVAR